MQYREYKNTGEMLSLLGFGTMRLPVINGNEGIIDEEEAIDMIRYAIDKGVNYVDTAYMYHEGKSEIVLGKALKNGYREKVFLADKMPMWWTKAAGGIEALFEEQFQRLGVTKIDYYLVHNLTKSIWQHAKDAGLMPFLEEQRDRGRIGKIGFSFHDDLETFKKIVDEYPWEFCQIQLNYMDKEFQAGVEGLKYAGSKGIPVIVMEPLKGGKLASFIPDTVKKVWDEADIKRSPAEWAFRYVADFPEVLTILSGMSRFSDIDENLRILGEAKPQSLTDKEKILIDEAAAEYNKLIKAACTACRYCLPCRVDIDIPHVMDLYNQWHIYKAKRTSKREYGLIPAGKRPSDCISCRQCEEQCPQHLPVSDIMREMAGLME